MRYHKNIDHNLPPDIFPGIFPVSLSRRCWLLHLCSRVVSLLLWPESHRKCFRMIVSSFLGYFALWKYAQNIENPSCDKQQYFDVELQVVWCVCIWGKEAVKWQINERGIFKSEEAEDDCHSLDEFKMKYSSYVQLCCMYLVLYCSIISIDGFAIQSFESILEIGILSSLRIRTTHLVKTYIVSKAKYLAILPISNDLLILINWVTLIISPFHPASSCKWSTSVVNQNTFQLSSSPLSFVRVCLCLLCIHQSNFYSYSFPSSLRSYEFRKVGKLTVL